MPRVVFMHIPKTAGVTLVRHLRSHLCRSPFAFLGRFGRFFTPVSVTSLSEHVIDEASRADMIRRTRGARLVHGHFFWQAYLEMDPQPDDVLITVLREPCDRLRSAYRFNKSLGSQHPGLLSRGIDVDAMTFADFLGHPSDWMQKQLNNGMTRYLGGGIQGDPRSPRDWEDLLAEAKAHLAAFTVVGFVEDFDRSLRRIHRACGMGAPAIASENVTPQSFRDLADDLDDSDTNEHTRNLLERCTCYDRQLYQHAKALHWDGLGEEG